LKKERFVGKGVFPFVEWGFHFFLFAKKGGKCAFSFCTARNLKELNWDQQIIMIICDSIMNVLIQECFGYPVLSSFENQVFCTFILFWKKEVFQFNSWRSILRGSWKKKILKGWAEFQCLFVYLIVEHKGYTFLSSLSTCQGGFGRCRCSKFLQEICQLLEMFKITTFVTLNVPDVWQNLLSFFFDHRICRTILDKL
jgi:hypothetical protein